MEQEIKNLEQKTLEQLVEKNIQLTEEIHRMSKRMNRYVTIQHILSVVYFLLIVVPLVASIIFLPPLINSLLNPYMELMNNGKEATDAMKNISSPENITDILNEAQKILNQNNK